MVKSLSGSVAQPIFVQIDVSKYADNIKLFRTALEKYGKIDHAVACAGIVERGKWFDAELTIKSVEKPESTQTLEINFLGSAYFTRIAVVYLKHGRKEGEDRSITLISSAAGFRDSPGLFMYQVRNSFTIITPSPLLLSVCSARNTGLWAFCVDYERSFTSAIK